MKNTIVILLFIFFCTSIQAQNSLSLNIETGAGVFFKTGPQLISLTDRYYFTLLGEEFSWNRDFYPNIALGATYETKTFTVLSRKYYIMTDLNLNYKNYGNYFYNVISISNNLYLPVRDKNKKLRIHFGIRNTYVLIDFLDEDTREIFPINRHIYGGLFLFNYQLNDQWKIGINVYGDINNPILSDFSGRKFRTLESTLKVSYRIK